MQSAFVKPQVLVSGGKWLPRLGFAILFVLSVFGNYVQFNGGWARAWVPDSGTLYAFLGAVAWQAIISYWQWVMIHKYGFWNVWYQIPLWLSVAPSIVTYAPVITPRTVAIGERLAGTGTIPLEVMQAVGLIVNVVICVLFDTMAERVATGRTAR